MRIYSYEDPSPILENLSISSTQKENKADTCLICLEPYKNGQKVLELGCQHLLHLNDECAGHPIRYCPWKCSETKAFPIKPDLENLKSYIERLSAKIIPISFLTAQPDTGVWWNAITIQFLESRILQSSGSHHLRMAYYLHLLQQLEQHLDLILDQKQKQFKTIKEQQIEWVILLLSEEWLKPNNNKTEKPELLFQDLRILIEKEIPAFFKHIQADSSLQDYVFELGKDILSNTRVREIFKQHETSFIQQTDQQLSSLSLSNRCRYTMSLTNHEKEVLETKIPFIRKFNRLQRLVTQGLIFSAASIALLVGKTLLSTEGQE